MGQRIASVCLSVLAAALLAPGTASATELPINLCAGAGASGESLTPSGGQPGTISYTPRAEAASLAKTAAGAPAFGRVDPATGAFIYDHDDLSIGTGEFPARLTLTRSFNSRMIVGTGRPVYRAGGERWYAFGFGSTHNLDIRIEASDIYFGKQRYYLYTVRVGFATYGFQGCPNGETKSLKGDGTRLFRDNSFSNGYRFEGRDGTRIWFESMPESSNAGAYYCNGSTRLVGVCGYARRWMAPNGDRADFSYEQYNSNATNQAWSGTNRDYAMTGEGVGQECRTTTQGAQVCREINRPWYVMRTGQTYPVHSYPVYDFRLKEVVNSRGFRLTFDYVDPTTARGGYCPSSISYTISCVSATGNVNMARNRVASVTAWVQSPSGFVQDAVVRYGYRSGEQSDDNYLRDFTDATGAVTRFTGIFDIQPPGQTAPTVSIAWGRMKGGEYYIHADEVYSTYDYGPSMDYGRRFTYYPVVASIRMGPDAPRTYSRTLAGRWLPDAYGRSRWDEFFSIVTVSTGSASSQIGYLDEALDDHYSPAWSKNELGYIRRFTYNPRGTLIREEDPEGSATQYAYDARGNVTAVTRTAKPGSGLGSRVERSGYVAAETVDANACPNILTCNRMAWVEDARGSHYDFEWSPDTGLPTRVLQAARDDGARGETVTTYASLAGSNGWPIVLPATQRVAIEPGVFAERRFAYTAAARRSLLSIADVADGKVLTQCIATDRTGATIALTKPMGFTGACADNP